MASRTPDPSGHPALIQPHGFLIGVTPDWRVAYASATIGDFLVNAGASPIGQPLADVLGDAAVHTLRNRLSLLRDADGSARVFALHASGTNRPIDVHMHMVGGDIMIEAQPATGQEGGDQIGLVRALASRLDGQQQLDGMLQEGARQLRALTGFDSVSLYRWNVAGTADLAAHCARGNLDPGPLPGTGRLRLIIDASASGIAIDPEPNASLLDRCLLQMPGAADRDAMGTAASLVRLPLKAIGAEWGVAVCLNALPRQFGLERFAAAELFSDLLALRIALLESRV